MPTATGTNELVFDFIWHDPETGLNWLYGKGCYDYATFDAHPAVVRYMGNRYVRSGYNSDTGSIAYRQQTKTDLVATPV
jgi:hypothetical protein